MNAGLDEDIVRQVASGPTRAVVSDNILRILGAEWEEHQANKGKDERYRIPYDVYWASASASRPGVVCVDTFKLVMQGRRVHSSSAFLKIDDGDWLTISLVNRCVRPSAFKFGIDVETLPLTIAGSLDGEVWTVLAQDVSRTCPNPTDSKKTCRGLQVFNRFRIQATRQVEIKGSMIIEGILLAPDCPMVRAYIPSPSSNIFNPQP